MCEFKHGMCDAWHVRIQTALETVHPSDAAGLRYRPVGPTKGYYCVMYHIYILYSQRGFEPTKFSFKSLFRPQTLHTCKQA